MALYSVCFYHQWALLVPTKLAPYSRNTMPIGHIAHQSSLVNRFQYVTQTVKSLFIVAKINVCRYN